MARNVSESDNKSSEKVCKWQGCLKSTFIFETVEEMFDHVKAEHIPKTIQNEDDEEEVVCEWENCETSTTRGDLKKKTEWMQNHFKTRHAKTAKTFKCLFQGCLVLKATSQEIETHVRLFHPVNIKKEKKTKPDPESATPTKEPNRVWRIVDGDVVWDPPMRVTKKTIVYYDDGPRYVFPTGCSRCNYDSDESELASDEYWSAVEYSEDDEETDNRVFPPPGAQHLSRIWHGMLQTSKKSKKPRRPRRMKKKKIPQPSNETNVSSVEKKLKVEIKTATCQKKEDSTLSELIIQEKKHINLEQEPEKIPTLEPHDNDKNNFVECADSQPDQAIIMDLYEEKTEEKREMRKRRSVRHSHELEDDCQKLEEKPTTKKKKFSTNSSKNFVYKKRPNRSCRKNVSLCEIDERIEAFEVTNDSPLKDNVTLNDFKVKKNKKVSRVSTTESQQCSPKKSVKIGKGKTNRRSLTKSPQKLKNDQKQVAEKPNISRKISGFKKMKNPERRPSRACRVLGSMEEVPFDIEIEVDFEKPKVRN